MRLSWIFLILFLATDLRAASPAAQAQADVIVTWMDVTEHALEVDLEIGSADSPERSRVSAEVALAMFEASNVVEQRYASALAFAAAGPNTSAEAAAASAAHTLLKTVLPAQIQTFDDALMVSLAGIPDGAEKQAGIAYGQRAAMAVRKHAMLPADALLGHYRSRTEPGLYIDPRLPSIKPFHTAQPMFLLSRIDEVRPIDPPALSSARYAKDLDEVQRLGAKNSTERPAVKGLLAKPWLQINYHPMMVRVARQPGRSLSQNARLFALAHVAIEDAWSAIMEAKMHFATWRPITAIRNADVDGNPNTQRDAAWEPLLPTPNHSDYPCGHCGVAAAFATVMETETGASPVDGIHLSSYEKNPGFQIRLPSWTAFVEEMSMSRIYAGAHTRSANEAAEQMGRAAAKIVLRKMLPRE